MADIHIGLSGFSYKPWQGPGRFYPEDLKSTEFLRYYATRYRVVELDGIWYRFPSEKTVQSWIDQTPSTFLFAPKAHRSITHIHRLKPEAYPSVQFLLQRLDPLRTSGRLGPILLQLPPNLRRDDARLQAFLDRLSKDVRWAMEFRHASWHAPEVETLLQAHGIAWAAVETDDTPAERLNTAGFCYIRLRRSAYRDSDLEEWGGWLKQQAADGRDCFVFCKHEDEGSPWVWADQLAEIIGSSRERSASS